MNTCVACKEVLNEQEVTCSYCGGSQNPPSNESKPQLKRNLTLFSVICLGLNGVIGQGIFLVPGKATALMGPAALIALALGGLLCFCIALCFAEVGSRIQGTGGAYLYARHTFGEFIGFEVGWMTCWVALISWATLANGFTEVLAAFIPIIKEGWIQKLAAITVVSVLTAINLFGVQWGARIVRFFTIAKLVPIAIFVFAGIFFINGELYHDFLPHGLDPLPQTTLMLLYAYAGFETLVVPAGEMKNPQRTVPLALFAVLLICTIVYMAVFSVAIGTFPDLAGHSNPIAAASEGFLGMGVGSTLIGLGIVLSVFGTNSGSALVNPRRFYAMAVQGDLPQSLAKLDSETLAPRNAIFLTWAGTILLTLSGSFSQLLVIGVLARFAQYIPTTLAVLILRRREGRFEGGYQVPFGPIIPIFTLGLCFWLLYHQDPYKLLFGLGALLSGVPFYMLRRRSADT